VTPDDKLPPRAARDNDDDVELPVEHTRRVAPRMARIIGELFTKVLAADLDNDNERTADDATMDVIEFAGRALVNYTSDEMRYEASIIRDVRTVSRSLQLAMQGDYGARLNLKKLLKVLRVSASETPKLTDVERRRCSMMHELAVYLNEEPYCDPVDSDIEDDTVPNNRLGGTLHWIRFTLALQEIDPLLASRNGYSVDALFRAVRKVANEAETVARPERDSFAHWAAEITVAIDMFEDRSDPQARYGHVTTARCVHLAKNAFQAAHRKYRGQ
jgi:hypothetical protein